MDEKHTIATRSGRVRAASDGKDIVLRVWRDGDPFGKTLTMGLTELREIAEYFDWIGLFDGRTLEAVEIAKQEILAAIATNADAANDNSSHEASKS